MVRLQFVLTSLSAFWLKAQDAGLSQVLLKWYEAQAEMK